jgi:hypothetical protein
MIKRAERLDESNVDPRKQVVANANERRQVHDAFSIHSGPNWSIALVLFNCCHGGRSPSSFRRIVVPSFSSFLFVPSLAPRFDWKKASLSSLSRRFAISCVLAFLRSCRSSSMPNRSGYSRTGPTTRRGGLCGSDSTRRDGIAGVVVVAAQGSLSPRPTSTTTTMTTITTI